MEEDRLILPALVTDEQIKEADRYLKATLPWYEDYLKEVEAPDFMDKPRGTTPQCLSYRELDDYCQWYQWRKDLRNHPNRIAMMRCIVRKGLHIMFSHPKHSHVKSCSDCRSRVKEGLEFLSKTNKANDIVGDQE